MLDVCYNTYTLYFQPGTVAYAAGWGAIIPDDQLGPLAFLIPKEQKRPKVLQVSAKFSFLSK